MVLGQARPVRRALVAGDSVYDTASTLDLLKFRLGAVGPEGIVRRRAIKPVNPKVGLGGTLSSIGGFVGAAFSNEGMGALLRRHRSDVREAQVEAKRAKARRRRDSRR